MNSELTEIDPREALQEAIRQGYRSKNAHGDPAIIYIWLKKHPSLGRKMMGQWTVYKEKLIELVTTGAIDGEETNKKTISKRRINRKIRT